MLTRMITINLTYNNWITLLILFALLVIVYVVAKRYFEKKIPSPDETYLRQLNREMIKIDEDLKQLKEIERYKK